MKHTHILAARRGDMHPDFGTVAAAEGLAVELLLPEVASGRVAVIPSRGTGCCLGLGGLLRSKVLCNLGTSSQSPDIATEIEKAKIAIAHGASLICDQSVGGGVWAGRRRLLQEIAVPVGTIPLYRAAEEARTHGGDPLDFDADDLFRILEEELVLGITQPGIHSMTREVAEIADTGGRLMPVVSRGGALMYEWIKRHECENPYFEQFDRLLDLCVQYGVPLTLILAQRSGTVVDGFEGCMAREWDAIRGYVRTALDEGVSVVADGIGHMRLDQIPDAIETFKRTCYEIPLGVLGPAVTDRGLGLEHVVNAIGTAVAVWSGANYCNACYPTEHLGLPEVVDIPEGIGASLIAVHAGDLARSGASSRLMSEEREISAARKKNRWGIQLGLALDVVTAKRTFERVGVHNVDGEGCSICGDMCPFVVTGQARART